MSVGNDTIATMDVGGTHVTAALVDIRSRTVVPGQLCRVPLDSHAPAAEIVAALVDCAAHVPAVPGSRWAIALPGPFDFEQGVGRYKGVGKFDALNGFDLRAALCAELCTGAISFHHDAEAFASGEWWAGAAQGHGRAVGITLGTGVGSSFLLDGRGVREGPGIPPDGRADLLRHEGRPLEESVSRHAIRQAYAAASGDPGPPDVREIADRARQGDHAAQRVFVRTFHVLGTVLGPCIAAFAPTILVVGGSIARSWDLVADPLKAGLKDGGVENVRVQPARLAEAAPLLGAAYLAGTDPQGAAKKECDVFLGSSDVS